MLNYFWLKKRKAEQIRKFRLEQTPDKDVFEKKSVGGYQMVNGLGEVVENVHQVTVSAFFWDGGNMAHMGTIISETRT